MADNRSFTLTFLGDVMLGRIVDQLFPQHVHNLREQHIAAHFIEQYPSLLGPGHYTPSSPWGTTLPLLQSSDLTLINLETSATTTSEPWPDKTFNYRMHPANLGPILHAANVDYASLANNHVLDFGAEGLVETAWTLRDAGIAFAGAGETTNQAFKPAVLSLPRQTHPERIHGQGRETPSHHQQSYPVHVYSATDHPRAWSAIPTFHLIDYSPRTRVRLRQLLLSNGTTTHPPVSPGEEPLHPDSFAHESHDFHHRAHHHHHHQQIAAQRAPALKIFSIHWGPNYEWHPADRIRALAHFLIDECEVDIVHGHSSHHIQGVEKYKGKLIIYGCGDFVDDYALNEEFRNDLGAVWRVTVQERGGGLALDRLEIFPTRIDRFRALLLDSGERDHGLVRARVSRLSAEMGTSVNGELGEDGQIIFDLR